VSRKFGSSDGGNHLQNSMPYGTAVACCYNVRGSLGGVAAGLTAGRRGHESIGETDDKKIEGK
jgi:hypothetical protein